MSFGNWLKKQLQNREFADEFNRAKADIESDQASYNHFSYLIEDVIGHGVDIGAGVGIASAEPESWNSIEEINSRSGPQRVMHNIAVEEDGVVLIG